MSTAADDAQALDPILTLAELEAWKTAGVPNRAAVIARMPRLMTTPGGLFLEARDPQRAFERRWEVCRAYSFAAPCAEALDAIALHGPLVEVGAGTGYWSCLLAARGVDVLASDLHPAGTTTDYRQDIGCHHPVEAADAGAFVRRHPDRNVLSVWPSYDADWLTEAVRTFVPGRVLCVIGESAGGCTADDGFFELLESDFEEIGLVRLPTWEGIHDSLTIHRRR